MNGAINDDLAKALGLFFCFFMRNLSGCYPEQFGLLHWQPKVGGESDTQFIFSMLSWSYFVFCFILRSSDVWISSSRSVVSIPDLQQLHCFRLSGTHAFDGEYIFFRFCPMEVYLDAPWFLRGMRAPTDGSPLKAFMTLSSMNSTGSEFVSSVLMLEHWMMVRFRDGLLTELPMELSPTGALQRCVVFPIGNVNEPCYFFSACKCVLRDCQSIWSKVLCWCNDSFFCFSGQWSGTIRDLEWNNASNHAAARVYLLSQCTIVRLRDLPLGDKIKPIIFRRFQIARMASLPCVFRFLIRMCQLETLRFASNVLCVVFCLRCCFVYQFS